MLAENDRHFLFRALNANSCLLFVGAGFSRDARNRRDEAIPDANGLAVDLWAWLAFQGDYDGSPLAELYEAALRSGRPMSGLRTFLEDRLLATEVPSWYETPTRIFWHRIYGTNADDVIEQAYQQRGGEPGLACINSVSDDYEDRDQFLMRIQYVKLNGSLPGKPELLTFSTREYARRSSQFDQWYDHFVRDYSLHPTVFVGSELREPLFWQAVESRQARGRNPEERPKSFLVAPVVSPAKVPILSDLNITHVPATGSEFFEWLSDAYDFPSRTAVLRSVAPESIDLLSGDSLSAGERKAFSELLTAFQRVPLRDAQQARPRSYFLGVAPRWDDIATEFDAPRELTRSLMEAVDEAWRDEEAPHVLGVVGSGGSGKSTVLMRAAYSLRQSGRQVFFSEGTDRPDIDAVIEALTSLKQRAILFIDNAQLFGPLLSALIRRVSGLQTAPIVVFAARVNVFERHLRGIQRRADSRVFEIGDLTDQEIRDIVHVLDRYGQLGRLGGMSEGQRFDEFKVRARKQILVAMREATEGYGFDEIIRNEFIEIDDREARILFLCGAVATAELVDLTREQWLACAEVAPAEALAVLRRNLRGMLIEDDRDRVAARHPVIAELIVDQIAERSDVSEAYVRLLNTVAHDIYAGPGRSTRTWRLFVRLIDHRRIFLRFAENLELARHIYISVAQYFNDDGHFWLQFANLEIEYGDSRNARTHLGHAESLMPDHSYVLNTRANLALREALEAETIEQALAYRREAEEILLEEIKRVGRNDEYPYHVYINRMLRWVDKWVPDRDGKRRELEKLREIAREARTNHGYSRRIRDVAERAEREYLSLALPSS